MLHSVADFILVNCRGIQMDGETVPDHSNRRDDGKNWKKFLSQHVGEAGLPLLGAALVIGMVTQPLAHALGNFK